MVKILNDCLFIVYFTICCLGCFEIESADRQTFHKFEVFLRVENSNGKICLIFSNFEIIWQFHFPVLFQGGKWNIVLNLVTNQLFSLKYFKIVRKTKENWSHSGELIINKYKMEVATSSSSFFLKTIKTERMIPRTFFQAPFQLYLNHCWPCRLLRFKGFEECETE